MIENLDLKLSGQEPITRKELLELVNSWGRTCNFYINDYYINICKPKEKYDLSNLDVSQMNDFSDIFKYSMYNGDISKWNMTNAINLREMFGWSYFNNNSLKNWDVSNVTNMYSLFYKSIFNGDISNWNISNVLNIKFSFSYCPFNGDISKWKFNKDVLSEDILFNNKAFIKKYNNGKNIPTNKEDFLQWFENNRINISNLNITKEEVLDFFSFNEKELTICEKI